MIELALRPKPTLGGFLDPLSGKIGGRVKKKPVMVCHPSSQTVFHSSSANLSFSTADALVILL